MKFCIRCNPVTELVDTPDGLQCRFHGLGYVLEERADPVEAPADHYEPTEIAQEGPAS